MGSESFKNATYVGIDSSVVYGDDGSATITNANTCRGFKFNTVGAHITEGVTYMHVRHVQTHFRH